MEGTDAEGVRSEVTGEPEKPEVLKAAEDPLLHMHSIRTEPQSKNPSASNIAFISLLFLLFFGVVCAALYLFGFFGAWEEESIDYGLITNLPDENIESFMYVTAEEDAFKEASSTVGELFGGGLLKEIKKANIAYAQYGGGASGYVVYLESGQSIPGFADKLGNYLYPSLSNSQNKLGIEKKNAQGIDYYLIKTPGGYSSPICVWQQGKGIVLLYYSDGYDGTNNKDCTTLIGKKSSKKKYEDLLKKPESIRSDLKTDDRPYAQGWFWQKASDFSIPDSPQAEEKSAYGQMYSDIDGIYIFGAGTGLIEKSTQTSGLCEGGSIIKTSGKEACYKDSTGSGISLMPLSSAVSYERSVGKYTIYAFAYPKKQDKETVKKKAEKFIFSVRFTGTEKTWADRKTLTVSVKEDDTHNPVEGAHLVVYRDIDTKLAEASTDASGKAFFKDLPIEYFQLKAEKEGFDLDSFYVSATDTNETIYLSSKSVQTTASKPRCGNAMCESGENCQSCRTDCGCKNGVCVNGVCKASAYSIDLPESAGMSWNISYVPKNSQLRISSDNCFYLDVISSSGREIDPYSSNVKMCVSASGDKYNATGPNSAAWFNWGGCSNVKDYNVSKGEAIILKVWTDKYSCQIPKFNILDLVGNGWVKYEENAACEDLADRHERYFCYYNLALQYRDINICENISDDDRLNEPVKKRGCISSIAVRERNETMCGLMNDSPMKASCYQSVALAKNDSYICRLIDDQRYLERDSCYRIIAYSKKDRSLCDMISADKERSDCYTGIGSLEQADSSAGDGRPYSVELGGATGDKWNVTYFPASDRIKIVSRFCFQLDVLRQTGEEVDPYEADVSTCKGPDAKIYNTTGKGSASWFYYSGCASEKYYNVKRGEELTLRVRTDVFCTSPTFNIYEDLGGRWIKYLNKTSSKAAGKSEQGAVKIFQIDGTDGSDGAVKHIKISAKLDLQFESIPFEEILITFDTSNTTQSMGYSASSSVGGRYDVFYFQEGPHYKEGYLSQGDMVAINFSSARPIRTDETVRIRIIPKHGTISSVDILCPEFMTRERIVLYAKDAAM